MKRFIKSKRAVAAVEFAMLILPFLTFITVLVEILLLIYQTVALDYLNSMAGQYASSFSYKDGYLRRYSEYLDNRKDDIGFFLKDDKRYIVKLKYCKNLQELKLDFCQGSNDDSKFIVYELTYKPYPIFLYNWIEKSKIMKSKVVYFNERYKSPSKENSK